MSSKINVNSKLFQSLIFLFGFGLSLWMFTTFQLHYDQEQILGKVHKLIALGEWTHFGNRGTGVGYIPGTLLTFLAGVPMMIWYSPYSAMFLILLTHVVALICFYFPLKKFFGPLAAVGFLILFWLSPWRNEQVELYNPSYLFIFSGLHFFSALKLSRERSFAWTTLHVFAMGLCGQVHFSVLILMVASLLLWIFKMVKVNWWGVLFGIFLTALTLLPYFLSLSSLQGHGVELKASEGFLPGKNLVLIYPVLKACIYWLRYSSFYYARHIFTSIHFDWIANEGLRSIVSTVFHVIKWPIGIVTLLVSIRIQWQFLKEIWKHQPFRRSTDRRNLSEESWFFHYGFYLFVGMLVAAGLSPVEFNHWHLLLCLPMSVALVSVGVSRWMEKSEGRKKWILAVVVYFLVYNSFAVLGSRYHDFRNSYHQQVLDRFPITTPHTE